MGSHVARGNAILETLLIAWEHPAMNSVRADLTVLANVTSQAAASAGVPAPAVPAAPPAGGVVSFAAVNNQLDASSQMLSSLVQLQSQWAQTMGSPGLSTNLPSLSNPLSGAYQGMLPTGLGSATDLGGLQSNLRGAYAPMLAGGAGASDDYNALGMRLEGMYMGMMGGLNAQMAQAQARMAPPPK